ncbi:MAG TPA: tetratricopeptide repeat protein [Polyangiaceae bacterium]|nr:tetratricopeptide repeat protein [Polyangiaceae bacterium]
MFRQVRFDCGACGEGFVDWHDQDWERSSVFCVHCGARIVAGASVPPSSLAKLPLPSGDARSARALGVLRSDGEGFRDTLPGLTEGDSSRDRDTEPPLPRAPLARNASQATSTAPKERITLASIWAAHRNRLVPIAALLLGVTSGVSTALVAEGPLRRLMNPALYQRLQLSEELARVSNAIDDGHWDRARDMLEHLQTEVPSGDKRVATLRARFTLGLILANRPTEAGRELSAVPKSASVRPSAADLQRVYDVWFPRESGAASVNISAAVPAASSNSLTSAAAPKAKVTVTRRELLSFARDRQHRVQLDAAERLYAEVLRSHPNDAEARCGLAEVQLLRGGTDDGAKLFERALSDNAGYVPAWVGLADVDWLRGRPERAACRYQAVIDRFPASSYPPYIAERIAQVTSSGVSLPKARTDVSAANACGD